MPGPIGHIKQGGLLSILPDIFVVARVFFPSETIQRICLKLHNTEEGVEVMSRIGLGKAWRSHMEADKASHSYTYSYADRVPEDAVMLLSGGLDSFCAWRLLGQPKAVYFAIGHKSQDKELERIKAIKEKFGGNITIDHRLNLKDSEYANGYIPFRNLFFFLLASSYSPNIIIAQMLEWAPDKNNKFYRKVEDLVDVMGNGKFQGINLSVTIYSPFCHFTKTQLVGKYLKEYPKEDLLLTRSCYSDKEVNCGVCGACVSRYVAMKNNGIDEEYETIPDLGMIKRKWSIADFRFENIPMYVGRWKEYRKFENRKRQ